MSYVYFQAHPSEIHGFDTEGWQDMDLLNESRSLVHTGKFLRQPETGFEWNGWTELFALLFDNYRKCFFRLPRVALTNSPAVVMTKPREKGGVTKYLVYRRASPILRGTYKISHLLGSPSP